METFSVEEDVMCRMVLSETLIDRLGRRRRNSREVQDSPARSGEVDSVYFGGHGADAAGLSGCISWN